MLMSIYKKLLMMLLSEDEAGVEYSHPGQKLYNLDDTVNVWSDYLRIHLHPKTVHIIDAYQHGR